MRYCRAALVLVLLTPFASRADQRPVDFDKDIKPILVRACINCHGAEKQRGGLRLDSRDAALQGGNTGVVLKSGDPARSRLLQIVAGTDKELQMPPEGKKPLTAEEVGLLRAWIEQGIKYSGTIQTGSGDPKKHWAFQPIGKPSLPEVQNKKWGRNGIDAFVLARLEKEKLEPSAEADRATLIRRLSLDLLGLPPTPKEVDDFINDKSPDAYEKLVDRLLANPHYGERWARHWLDLARYADSDGYEKDTGRPFAWRWRNWVIDALNNDKPFDAFTIEQLAGDLLPNATVDNKVATGFHRNTLTNKEGGVDREQFRVEAVVDRVNTTAKTWLGLTLGCAQCHDHKYDPLSQREYYQFFAFFNRDVETDIAAPLGKDDEPEYQRKKAAYDKKLTALQEQIKEHHTSWEKALTPAEREKLPAAVSAVLQVEVANRTAAQRKTLSDHLVKNDAKSTELNKQLVALQKTEPKPTQAQTLALGPVRKTHVMIRGDFLRQGVEVKADVPGVFPGLPKDQQANRLDLAKWITDPANPLTRRVLANWVWHKYFGRGLVATLEDFGTQGERPSHPELLDWLAGQLLEHKWSLRQFHKVIVTSATYRQSSHMRPEHLQRDPYNVLLARQSRLRLEAEVIRDSSLAVSGLLTRTIGGPSVRPPQPSGISELTYAGSAKWVESTGPDRFRRGLYIWFQRTSPYPMLLTFDAPDSNLSCVRRDKSNTPLQALTLLNDTVFVETAQALGKRIAEKKGTVKERAQYGFRLALGREPSVREVERIAQLFDELHELCKANPTEAAKLLGVKKLDGTTGTETAAWVVVARALLNLDEFVTRE